MNKKSTLAIIVIFLFSFNCYAEGQDGVNTIVLTFYYILALIGFMINTFIEVLLIKLFLRKFNLLLKNQTHKAFYISVLISIFASIIFGDHFIFLIWNAL